jgi:hypothetical protein
LASIQLIVSVKFQERSRHIDPRIDPRIETSLIDSPCDSSLERVESPLLVVVDHSLASSKRIKTCQAIRDVAEGAYARESH